MELPTLNLNLIIDQIEWADVSERFRQNPESVTPAELMKFQGWGLWNQGTWASKEHHSKDVCGTAYCQAGEAVVRAGYKIAWDGRDQNVASCYRGKLNADTILLSIPDVGAEVLGLTEEEAGLYFDGDNTIDDLKFYANAFAARRGLALPFEDDLALNSAHDEGLYTLDDVLEYFGDPVRV